MARLSLSLLGPWHVTLDGQPVTGFESSKVRALLAYLAIEADRPHHRDALAGLLWPEAPDSTARNNLRQALANLRQAIGDRTAEPSFLEISRETVQFNRTSDHELDVAAFTTLLSACDQHPHRHPEACKSCAHRLQQIAETYRGDFLAQFSIDDSTAFEEWAVLKREHFHQRAVDALARLAAYYERRRADEQAQRTLARQIELDPWREEAHQSLMRLLARGGQRSAALAQYETCCRLLADELGVEPTAETTVLYERIRDGLEIEVGDTVKQASQLASLPIPPTPLVGRTAELTELSEMLENPACRLITIVGPGGIGKTRLALAAAAEGANTFTHGVAFVPLASLGSAEFLISAIAAALEFAFYGPEDPKAQLLNYLRHKEILLAMDNFEHILEGASLVAEILRVAPGVSVMVTSRERLSVHGEWLFELQGLRFPENEAIGRSGAHEYSAVQLFLESARRMRADFALSGAEQSGVVRICQLVAGMPLGIELAAAWVRAFTCMEIAAEIERNLSFLAAPIRDIPERHRSLRAVFDHSWKLLSEEERSAFRKLSVFRGGIQRADAEQIAGATPWLLASLTDKSLLRRNASGRYDIHELLRQYAGEKLLEASDEAQVRDQHLAHFLQVAEQAEPELHGARQIEWFDRLEAEHDNLRAALRWSLNSDKRPDAPLGFPAAGLRLAGALGYFWGIRGHWNEGREWLRLVLASSQSGEARDLEPRQADSEILPASPKTWQVAQAKALCSAGALAFWQDDYGQMVALGEASLTACQAVGDRWGYAYALALLGYATGALGDPKRATTLLEESLARFQEVKDKWGMALALAAQGLVAAVQVNYEQAAALLGESLALFREVGDRWGTASMLINPARWAYRLGDYARATALQEEALALFRELGNKGGIAQSLHTLGQVAQAQGDYARARALYSESQALSQDLGSRHWLIWTLCNSGYMMLEEGDVAQAESLFRESVALARELGDKGHLAEAVRARGIAARHQMDYGRAQALLAESLALARDLGNKESIAESLNGLAGLAAAQDQPDRAARLFGTAEVLYESIGLPIPPIYRAEYDRNVAATRDHLGEAAFAMAWAEGRALRQEQAMACALAAEGEFKT